MFSKDKSSPNIKTNKDVDKSKDLEDKMDDGFVIVGETIQEKDEKSKAANNQIKKKTNKKKTSPNNNVNFQIYKATEETFTKRPSSHSEIVTTEPSSNFSDVMRVIGDIPFRLHSTINSVLTSEDLFKDISDVTMGMVGDLGEMNYDFSMEKCILDY